MKNYLANIFVYRDLDPSRAALVDSQARSSGFFDNVQVIEGWVTANKELPLGQVQPSTPTNPLFAEASPSHLRGKGFDRLTQLAAEKPDLLAEVAGDFTFVHFDDGMATAVRSCGGRVPLYVYEDEERVAISTILGWIPQLLKMTFKLDPLVNGLWTTGYGAFPDGRTFFRNIYCVPRGGFRRSGPRARTGTYWFPQDIEVAVPGPQVELERAERFRVLLLEGLEEELSDDGVNLLFLSGGVDSSAIGSLAGADYKVASWTLLPPSGASLERELSFINPVAYRSRFERVCMTTLTNTSALALFARPPSTVFHVFHPGLLLLGQLHAETGAKVLFGGEFADEVCGSSYTVPDWVMNTSSLQLLGLMAGRELPLGKRDMLRWPKHRMLQLVHRPMLPFPKKLPELLHENVHREYREWRSEYQLKAAKMGNPRRYLYLNLALDGFLMMHWETASPLGIRRVFPFSRRSVLEFAFQTHPIHLIGPGGKRLLRMALSGHVPERNLNRSDKGRWFAIDPRQVKLSIKPTADLDGILRQDWLNDPPQEADMPDARRVAQLMQIPRALERSGVSTYPQEQIESFLVER